MNEQNDVYVKWYHWVWLWVLKTNTVSDIRRRKSYEMETKMYYKQAFGNVYIVKTTYEQHKIPNARQVRKGIKIEEVSTDSKA